MIIETMTFRLRTVSDEEAFLEADKRLQTEFAYQQPGLVRRTTARGEGDLAREWIVVDLWETAEAADACNERWGNDLMAQAFMAHVDPDSIEVRRYRDLE